MTDVYHDGSPTGGSTIIIRKREKATHRRGRRHQGESLLWLDMDGLTFPESPDWPERGPVASSFSALQLASHDDDDGQIQFSLAQLTQIFLKCENPRWPEMNFLHPTAAE